MVSPSSVGAISPAMSAGQFDLGGRGEFVEVEHAPRFGIDDGEVARRVRSDDAAGQVLDKELVVRLALPRLRVETRIGHGHAELFGDEAQRGAPRAAVDAAG